MDLMTALIVIAAFVLSKRLRAFANWLDDLIPQERLTDAALAPLRAKVTEFEQHIADMRSRGLLPKDE